MQAHLLTIGDEILIGQIVDTNSAWMSRQLNLRGIRVTGKSSVGDTRAAIINGLEYALTDADVVIITGGLGPTKDDITKKTLADYFESGFYVDESVRQRIAGYFEKLKRPMPPDLNEQATLPEKAVILANKVGTASGMWFEREGKVVVSLPGVPFEMEYLMTREVMPRLVERFQPRPIAHRTLLTACIGESVLSARLENFEGALPEHIKLAYLPTLGQVRLRLTGVWPGDITEDAANTLDAELDRLADDLERQLGALMFGREEDTLESVVGRLCKEKGLRFATAESCTGGHIAQLIASVPGASTYFQGGAVTYSNDMKQKMLGVRADTLAQHGAVSEACVREMAQGALRLLEVDLAVSISGIAGPDGGTPDKPVGMVWMCVASNEQMVSRVQYFARDRAKNVQLASVYALDLVRRFLEGKLDA